MTRARTGSHSRTEPGAVHAYEVVDHGIDNASYFGGCGIAHTDWDDVAVGVGNSPLEAYEDAVEALAQAGWEVDALPAKPRGLSSESELQNVVDYDDGDELQHYVCVYVRGIPTRRTRMAQQRRAGTVGPGRPGQQFTHGDVEIETTLHPIDLDGVSPRTRRGTRVRFEPNAASHLLYSERYGLPERGEEGTVTYMPGFKPKTYMQGPGGGLLYVEWDQAGVLGVSPNDVVKAGEADPYQQYRVGAVDDDDAAEAPTFDWQNAEYFGAYLEGDEGVGTGAYVATAKFKGTWWAMVDTQGPDGVLLRKGGFKSQHAAYAVATKRAERWIAAVQDAG